jgi:hypothetical protein
VVWFRGELAAADQLAHGHNLGTLGGVEFRPIEDIPHS